MRAVRARTRLPLDGLRAVMRDAIPHLSSNPLHRAPQRPGVSRLPKAPAEKPRRSKPHEIGCFHAGIAELRRAGGKAFLFVVVDRTSKLVFARIHRTAGEAPARGFRLRPLRAVPCRVHTVPTDDGARALPDPGSAGPRRGR